MIPTFKLFSVCVLTLTFICAMYRMSDDHEWAEKIVKAVMFIADNLVSIIGVISFTLSVIIVVAWVLGFI